MAESGITHGRVGIVGGSGVQLDNQEPWLEETPFGPCLLSHLDANKQIVFASRHNCTNVDRETQRATYAPPHEVNFHALVWALVVKAGCTRGLVALGSTGTLHPETIPVGSVVMPDDYYMVHPEPVTFWGNKGVGAFEVPEGGSACVHYAPADPCNDGWNNFRTHVQQALGPLLQTHSERIQVARGQTPELWPCVHGLVPGSDLGTSLVYVNTVGPRFETRAEIRAYQQVGHIVGMTCGKEWALCEELQVPYCLVCFCDNACNGLSKHPKGALQEYLDHKQTIAQVTGAVVLRMAETFSQACEPCQVACQSSHRGSPPRKRCRT